MRARERANKFIRERSHELDIFRVLMRKEEHEAHLRQALPSRDEARAMYDSSNIGAFYRDEVLQDRLRRAVLFELRRGGRGFKVNPRNSQEHFTIFDITPHVKLPAINLLRQLYVSNIYNRIARMVDFPAAQVEEIRIEAARYPQGGGISFHRDSRYAYLIGIFSVDGRGRFSLSRSFSRGTEEPPEDVGFEVNPGGLTVMRAPRYLNQSSTDYSAPLHSLKAHEARWSISFRFPATV